VQQSYTAEQIRQAERIALARTPEGALMARAARAVADAVLSRMPSPIPGRAAVLLVGPGNNGGDALYAGALLLGRGMQVTAILADPDRAHLPGMTLLRRRGGRAIAAGSPDVPRLIGRADAIVDGLVGIGARPPLRAPMDDLVRRATDSPAWRIAVDLPSGIDPDDGRSPGAAFDADITVTMGGLKTGLLLSDLAGDVRVATIGMDPASLSDASGRPIESDADIVTDDDVAALMPQPGAQDDKFSLGVTGVLAGSVRYPGAALLAVGGAVRMRPGLVRYAGPQALAVVQRWPEAVVGADPASAGRVQAWVAGPGLGTDGAALAPLRDVLDADVPVLVDADGLTLLAAAPSLLARRSSRGAVTVLTPHAGEFVRLFPDLDPADRPASVRAAAVRSGAIVLLKGHRTVLADPAGRTMINTSGSPWLATAGSGDVLAGMAGSLLATGLAPLTAVALAAHIHGRAGERAAAAGRAGASALLDLLH
jgi:hydroxyethylthiazole kinase-like uncharacterized protein yjeF